MHRFRFLRRRNMKFAHAAAAGFAAGLVSAAACGQIYPDKPVRVVVPTPAGATTDVVARLVMPGIANLLEQQFVLDDRGGAGGLIGAEIVAKSAADGYTLMFSGPGPLTILPSLYKQVPFDTLKDFAPVGLVSSGPFVLVAHPSAPFRTVKELIALAKADPRRFTYASAGNGSPNHLATELFKSITGINLTHVPYKGGAQAMTDVLGGHVMMVFSSIAPVQQHLKAGRLVVLGITSERRSPQLPEVATMGEAGVPGYEFSTWFGLLAPARTPAAIITRLNGALVKAARAPEMTAQFANQGADPVGSTPDEFAAYIRREFGKNAKIIKSVGMKVD